MYKGELILIGAGPGDPDLITVKAWRTLRQADIILYDNLANPALLDIASRNCERIPVGKRPHGPTTTQEEIHEALDYSVVKMTGYRHAISIHTRGRRADVQERRRRAESGRRSRQQESL